MVVAVVIEQISWREWLKKSNKQLTWHTDSKLERVIAI